MNSEGTQNTRAGLGSRVNRSNMVALAVAGNSTVKGQIPVKPGSWLRDIAIETPTAISAAPTSSLVRVGTTDGGNDIVADVDAKSQGHIAATIVAAFDKIAGLANFSTLYVQVVTSGSAGSPAGTVNVMAGYASAP